MSSRRQFIQSTAATGSFLGSYGPFALADVGAISAKSQKAVTPDQALEMLKEGNERFVQKVAEENVRLNVEALLDRSAVLKGLTDQGQLKVVGAMHDIGTGRVTFYT